MKKVLLSILCLVAMAITGYAAEATVTFSELGYSNSQVLSTVAVDENVTLTFSKGDGTTDPAYYNTGTAARLYANNTLTISVPTGFTIESVVMNTGSSNKFVNATVTEGTLTVDGTVGTISGVNGETTTLTQNVGGSSGHVRINDITVTYTSVVASNVATPTFSVEAGTYGVKQSIELACASNGADIYYTLDGTTPDKNATLYETAIELNTKTTVKAIAYVGEEASNVASATYDFRLEGSLSFINSPIIANTMQAKVEWASEDWANNTVNYLVTLDGTTPTLDNKWTSGKSKTRQLPMYSWKKDSVVTVSVRAEQDGIYSDVFAQTVFVHYDGILDYYRTITTMEAGNYLIMTSDNIAHTFLGNETYGWMPKVDVANTGTVSAYGFFEWTFEATEGGYYIKDSKGRYIYMSGTYNNFNVSTTVPTEGAVWTVTINNDGTAQIMNVEKQKFIQYSPEHNTYGSYAEASDARVLPQLAKNATPVVVMTPELDGVTLQSLSEVTFYCADGLSAGSKINNNSFRNSNYDTFKYTVVTVDNNTIKFVFEQPITATDSYTFSYAKESFIAGPGTFDMVAPSANKSIKFNVVNPYEIIVTPSTKDRAESLDVFTFANQLGITLNPDYEGEAPYLSYKDGEGVETKISLNATSTTDTLITYAPANKIETEGTYTLVVGEGYFLIAGEQESPAFNNEYDLVFPLFIANMTPAADEVVASFTELNIEFNKYAYVDADLEFNLVDSLGNKTALSFELSDTTSVEVPGYWGNTVYKIAKKVRFYVAEPITAEGKYTLSIPGYDIYDPINTIYLPKTEIVITVGKVEEPKLEGSLTFINSPILANTMQAKIEWASEDWANNTVNYLVTLDGTVPTLENKWNTGKSKSRQLPMYSWKKDSVVTVSVRAEQDGLYSDVFTQTTFVRYDAALDSYRATAAMEAGNYLMITPEAIAYTFFDATTSGNIPAVKVANNNGIASAFGLLEWAFEATEGGYYIKDSKGRYVYIAGENFAVSETLPAEAAVWSVTINADSTAQVKNVAKEMFIQYSPELNAWGCYAETSEARVLPQLAKNVTPQVIMTPDLDGTTLSSLSEITFYCADGIATTKKTANNAVRNSNYDTFKFTIDTVDNNTIKFVFDEPLTASDDYTFNYVKESFIAGPGTFDMIAPAANKSLKFKILNPYEIVVTPENKDRVENLNVFTFANSLGLVLNPDYEGEAPYLSSKDSEGNETKVNLTATLTTDTLITYATASSIDVEGTYTLVVGEGYFLIAGEKESPAMNKEYELVFPLLIASMTPETGSTIPSFTELNIEFNKYAYVDADLEFNLVDSLGNKTALSFELSDTTSIEVPGYWGNTVYKLAKKVRFYVETPITTAGVYTLSIPGYDIYDPINTVYLPKTEISFTVEEAVVDYIFNASDHEVGKYAEGITDGIFTFVQGTGTDKNWEVKANNATFNIGEGLKVTNQVKPNSNKNYLTIDVPAEGTLVFGVRSGSNDDLTRTMVVAQGNDTVYNQVICEANDKVDDVYNTHNVKVEAGTATVTMPTGTLLFYYIEFIPGEGGEEEEGITATWSIEEGAVIESFSNVTITFAGEGIESAKAKSTYSNFIFYEKDAEGNYNLTSNDCTAGYMDTEATGTTVTFSVDPGCYGDPFNRKGEYRIVIPAGNIVFNGDKTNVSTEEYVLNFTIENDYVAPTEIDAAFTADPANNSKVAEITEIVITFTDYTEVTVAEMDMVNGSNIPMAQITDPEFGMTMPAGYMMTRAGAAANQLVVYVDPAYTGGLESFATAGEYTINIPAGVVKFGNDINKAFTLNYTVEGVTQTVSVVSSDPANNSTVNKLESVVVEWNMAITMNEENGAYVENVHGIQVSTIRPVWTGLPGNQVRLVLNTPATESGIYNLVIPAGEVKDFDTESIVNEEVVLTFTVDAPATGAPAIVSTDPADGATVDAIESITVVFNKPVVYDNYFESASLQDKGGKVIANVKSTEYKDGDDENGATTITFVLDNKVVEANTFYFVIPAKTIVDAYDWITMMEKDASIAITIAGAGVDDITVISSTPSANSTVKVLEEISVEFNTGAAVLYTPNVVDETGAVLSTTKSSYTDAEGNTLPDNVARFILNTPIDPETPTNVYLVIEAGSVYDYPNYAISNSEEIRIMIAVSGQGGINGVEMDPVYGYVVYDLNGYRVMQTKKAADLERLNNGIYIINGVKVLINK